RARESSAALAAANGAAAKVIALQGQLRSGSMTVVFSTLAAATPARSPAVSIWPSARWKLKAAGSEGGASATMPTWNRKLWGGAGTEHCMRGAEVAAHWLRRRKVKKLQTPNLRLPGSSRSETSVLTGFISFENRSVVFAYRPRSGFSQV